LRRVLRYFLLAILIVLMLAGGGAWWIVHRALPQVDGTATLAGLQREVTVDRDTWGIPYIQAGSLDDLLEAQGYVVAQDRLWQMDVLRRVAAGELSEIFGRRTLALDRQYRTLGLRAAAQWDLAHADAKDKRILEAYARGVNRFIEEHNSQLPWEFVALRYKPRPWTPADSLLVAGYMYDALTRSWESELDRARVTEIVGAERAKDLYTVDTPRDHFIVGEAAPPAKKPAQQPAKRNGTGSAAPAQPTGTTQSRDENNLRESDLDIEALVAQFGGAIREEFGSNNWVVDGTHTASGKPLLANDTHLQLAMPCIWYLLHLKAPGWNVEGFTLPGAPLVIIGHNERIAWGFTNNGADVQDLYIETFNPQNPHQYRVNGNWKDAEVRQEVIHVRGEADVALDVVITRHGPIVRSEGGKSYALRWTAIEPWGLIGSSYYRLGAAQNWQEFREVMRGISGPTQSAVYADVDGHIGYIVAARIPVRQIGNGAVPVPGDTDEYEWIGYIPFDELPQVLDPPSGIIATANAKIAGPGYKYFLTERWAGPSRVERIYELLNANNKLRPEDFLKIQTDIVSLPAQFLAKQLLTASQSANASDERARELIGRLKNWDGRATVDSVETAFVEYTRRELQRNLVKSALGNNPGSYRWWRDFVFLEKVLTERPAGWLPPEFHSYDELLMASADTAVKRLETETQSKELTAWRWGHLDQLQMLHPLGQWRWLRGWLGIGPIDQPGTSATVKQTGVSFGPSMRMVADLSDWDHSLMNLTTGESGQLGSENYKDQFPIWFEGRGLAAPFSDVAKEKNHAHRMRLMPVADDASVSSFR
jgi:penicillin amidase